METDASSKVEPAAEMLNALQMLWMMFSQPGGEKHLTKRQSASECIHSKHIHDKHRLLETELLPLFASISIEKYL